jgi:hypothetical protein
MRRGILATIDELKALRDRVDRRPFSAIHDTLRKRCALILETAPITEAQWRSTWQSGGTHAAVTAARNTQGRILDLLIAHNIEPNGAYRSRAIEELRGLIHWSSWVDPSHTRLTADPCTAESAVAAVIALDWLHDEIDENLRAEVRQAIHDKALTPFRHAVEKKEWWYTCYHSWNAVINGGLSLVSLALSDEDPLAEETYRDARQGLTHFFDALPSEGGWDEGPGYWGRAVRYVLLAAEAARRLEDDETIIHRRGMDQTGLFGVYFSPNGVGSGFGENPTPPLLGTMYLLDRYYESPAVRWWLDTYSFHNDVGTSGWSAAGLAMLFRDGDAPIVEDPQLEPVKVFDTIGWAAMADTWPRPKMYVSAKTGDLSANHSQRDMNSLQLHVDGEALLIDPGGSGQNGGAGQTGDELELIQARSHNTITVAEADHLIDAQGRIRSAESQEGYRWLACDAGDALGEGVTFMRYATMVLDKQGAGQALIVLDNVMLATPEKVEMFWHTLGRTAIDPGGKHGLIAGRRNQLHFAMVGTCPVAATVEKKDIGHGRTDSVLTATCGVMGPAWILSAFSLVPLEGEPRLAESVDGVQASVGPFRLTLTREGRLYRVGEVSTSTAKE